MIRWFKSHPSLLRLMAGLWGVLWLVAQTTCVQHCARSTAGGLSSAGCCASKTQHQAGRKAGLNVSGLAGADFLPGQTRQCPASPKPAPSGTGTCGGLKLAKWEPGSDSPVLPRVELCPTEPLWLMVPLAGIADLATVEHFRRRPVTDLVNPRLEELPPGTLSLAPPRWG